ncbi:hypothetical protein EV421DRAFT_1706641, partial [Armillaria borealis]
SLSRSASLSKIKATYHRMLLQHHPDKNTLRKDSQTRVDVSCHGDQGGVLYSVRSCFTTHEENLSVISLDDFDEEPSINDSGHSVWTYKCRCSGVYTITDEGMEFGHHYIACSNCSELI